jgi:hypothetical protein
MEKQIIVTTVAATGANVVSTEPVHPHEHQQKHPNHFVGNVNEDILPALGEREKGPASASASANPDLKFLTFSMPSNHDDRSIASTITMSTIITDHSASVDVFDFSGETLEDCDAVLADDEQASEATPDGLCFQFEKVMDSVFVKMYEVFVDEDAMMFACQDEASACTPILEYNSLPDIPATISMAEEETIADYHQSLQLKNLDDDQAAFKKVDDQPTLDSQHKMALENSESRTVTTRALSDWDTVIAATAIVEEIKEKEGDDESHSYPWRLDSILSSSPDRKDECIEVRAACKTIVETSPVMFHSSFFAPTSPVTVIKPVAPRIPSPLEKTTLSSSPSITKSPSPSLTKQLSPSPPSITKQELLFSPSVPLIKQTPLYTSDNSSTSKSTSWMKRSLGLRYLFSPRLRKLSVLPWKRRNSQKYQCMPTMDDPSYSPETVTTLEPSTLYSDALSFQCDMSLKTSSVMSLRTTSVFLKQDLHPISQRRTDNGRLSYAYPQIMGG